MKKKLCIVVSGTKVGKHSRRKINIIERFRKLRTISDTRPLSNIETAEVVRIWRRHLPSHTSKMQHRVRCTPLHFVIPAIGAAEGLINCSSTLLFRNKWGGRVDSYYRGGIQISWRYMAEVSPSFSFAISAEVRPFLFFFRSTEPRLFCFQDIPKSPPCFCHYRSPRR